MPRVSAKDRAVRDRLIGRLFISGASYREIARHPRVQLSVRGVELAVRRTLGEDREHVNLLTSEAGTVALMRLETLLRAGMPRALDGNMRAFEACRKLIEQEARMLGVDRPHNGHDLDGEPEQPEPGQRGGATSLEEYRRQFRERHEGGETA